MSRRRIIVVAAVVALAVVGAWWMRSRSGAQATRYRTAAVERGDLTATVSATGSVRPVVQVQVGSQVSGTISELRADYNSRVRAGQVLAQIEPSSFRTRVVQAEASLAKADAALAEARRQLSRAQELQKKGDYVSQADVDAVQSTVDQATADRQQAEAQLASARVDLTHTTIRSPIDGVVISRSVDVGQTVAASLQAPELFVIANDLTQMQVETRIDEADIGRIHPDLPVRFTVDAFPDATFEGRVSLVRLEPITEQNVVTYTTVMRTRNDDLRLRPGMTANVTVLVDQRRGVLKVPNAALRFRPQDASGNANGAAGGRGRSGSRADAGARGGGMRASSTSTAADGAASRAVRESGGGRSPGGNAGAGRRDGGGGHAWSARRDSSDAVNPFKPGSVYVLRDGKLVSIPVLTGITDGSATEIRSDQLKEGDQIVTGVDFGTSTNNSQLQAPPGLGGSPFRGRR